MGYRNAGLVTAYWGTLPGAAFKVLTRMALSSRDGDKPPHYRAGTGPLLIAMGRPLPEPEDHSDDAERVRECNAEMLRRAVLQLRQAGVVTYAVAPARHRTPEYWLHLEPALAQQIVGARPNKSLGQEPARPNKSLGQEPSRPPGSLGSEMKDLQMSSKTDEAETTALGFKVTSPARVIGSTDHGCIRGWLPDDHGRRSGDRCPTCHPNHLRSIPPLEAS